MDKKQSKKGSVILPTLLIILIIVAAGSTYLSMSFQEFKMSHRNQDLQAAINLAEAGIEEAMVAMKNEDWTGWTKVAADNYYYDSIYSIGTGSGRVGTWKVYASIVD